MLRWAGQESLTSMLSCHREGFHTNPSAAPGHLVGMGTTRLVGTNLHQAGSCSWVGFWETGSVTPCWPQEPEQEVGAVVYGSLARRKACCFCLASVTSWTDMSGTRSFMQYFHILCYTDAYATWQGEAGMLAHGVPLYFPKKSMPFPTYFLLIPADLPLPFLLPLLALPACLTWRPSMKVPQKSSRDTTWHWNGCARNQGGHRPFLPLAWV